MYLVNCIPECQKRYPVSFYNNFISHYGEITALLRNKPIELKKLLRFCVSCNTEEIQE